jgi:hypothetical protein
MEVPQKKILKIVLPYDPTIPLLGIYPKGIKSAYQRDNLHPYTHCSTIHNSQDMEQLRCSSTED